MLVKDLILFLQAMPQDAHVMMEEGERMYPLMLMNRIVPIERGTFSGLRADTTFTSVWASKGSHDGKASNLISIETAQAVLIGV